MRSLLILSFTTLLLLSACKQEESFPLAQTNDWKQIIDTAVAMHEPGMILYLRKGNQKWEYLRGMAIYEKAEAHTRKNPIQLGRLSEQFTAMALLKLVEEGKVDLNQKLAPYFPHWPLAKEISFADLAFHKSRLKEYTEFERASGEPWFDLYAYTQLEVIRYLLQSQQSTEEKYAASNYILLQELIERLSGQKFHRYLEQSIYQELMLQSCFNQHYLGQALPKHALGYAPNSQALRAHYFRNGFQIDSTLKWIQHPDEVVLLGSSDVYCSFKDFVKFEEQLFKNLRDPNSQYQAWFNQNKQPMCFSESEFKGQTLWDMKSMGSNHSHYVALLPEADLVLVILSNRSDEAIAKIGSTIMETALKY